MKSLFDNFSGNVVPDDSNSCASGAIDYYAEQNSNYNNIYLNGGGTNSDHAWSLEELYEQSAITTDNQTINQFESIILPVNTNDAKLFLYFSNVRSYVDQSITNIVNEFPFGMSGKASFAMYSGGARIEGSMSSTYNPKLHSFQTTGNGKYDLTEYSISTGSTGTNETLSNHELLTTSTYALYVSDDSWSAHTHNPPFKFYVFPSSSAVQNFISKLGQYEIDLVDEYRTVNAWPRHDDGINLKIEGAEYDSFVESEKNRLATADTRHTDVLWRNYVPRAYKQYDVDDILYNLISTYSSQYDEIKLYADHIGHAHTIDFEDYDHVPVDVIDYLARQWSLSLYNDVNTSSYDSYIFNSHEVYYSGSSRKISAKELNFEKWRRILANIAWIYKKKGTRHAFDFLFNLYNLPDDLASLVEYIEIPDELAHDISEDGWQLRRDNNKVLYVGSGSTSGYTNDEAASIKNSRVVEVGIFPSDAIEHDLWEWADSLLGPINGITLSGTGLAIDDWENFVLNKLIPSYGRLELSSYDTLSNIYDAYLVGDNNPLTYDKLGPYIDFVEHSYIWIAQQFLPVSVYMRGVGIVYRNLIYKLPKYKLNPSKQVDLPPHPEIEFTGQTLSAVKNTNANYQFTDVITINASGQTEGNVEIDSQYSAESKISTIMTGIMYDPTTATTDTESFISYPAEVASLTKILAMDTFIAPTMRPIGSNIGVDDVISYSAGSIITSLDQKIDLVFTGFNFTVVGGAGTGVARVELFRRLSDEEKFSISSVEYEFNNHIENMGNGIGRYYFDDVKDFSNNVVLEYSSSTIHDTVDVIAVNRERKYVDTYPIFGVKGEDNHISIVPNDFNWVNPIQTIIISNNSDITNISSDDGSFDWSVYSGNITIGGFDSTYNQEILVDKNEYCYRWRAEQQYTGLGLNLISDYISGTVECVAQDWDYFGAYNSKYYGRYFMFIKEPKQPFLVDNPDHNVVDLSLSAASNTVLYKWNGTGDADRIDIEFYKTEANFTGGATMVSAVDATQTFVTGNPSVLTSTYYLPERTKGNASYYHTTQATLEAGEWYWWRIKNMRGKINMFGYETYAYVATGPKCFLTGGGESGVEQGEITAAPSGKGGATPAST